MKLRNIIVLLVWYGGNKKRQKMVEKMRMVCSVDASALLYNSFVFFVLISL